MATSVMVVSLFLAVALQAGGLPTPVLPDCFSSFEKSRITGAQKIEKRIKIYGEISDERRRSVEKAVAEQNLDAITLILGSWKGVLEYSLSDIQANAGKKRGSGALKHYEIKLRKAVSAINDLKTKGSYEQLEEFELWLKYAGEIQAKLMAILFPG